MQIVGPLQTSWVKLRDGGPTFCFNTSLSDSEVGSCLRTSALEFYPSILNQLEPPNPSPSAFKRTKQTKNPKHRGLKTRV